MPEHKPETVAKELPLNHSIAKGAVPPETEAVTAPLQGIAPQVGLMVTKPILIAAGAVTTATSDTTQLLASVTVTE